MNIKWVSLSSNPFLITNPCSFWCFSVLVVKLLCLKNALDLKISGNQFLSVQICVPISCSCFLTDF